MSEVTYCEICLTNFTDDNDFDHRFTYPVCLTCADKDNLVPDNPEGLAIYLELNRTGESV